MEVTARIHAAPQPQRLPKGYRVTVRKDSKTGMYDCTVWFNGDPVLFHSPTLFNYPEQAREWGRDWAVKDNRKGE